LVNWCGGLGTALDSVFSVGLIRGGDQETFAMGSGAELIALPTFPPGKITEKKNLYQSTVCAIPSSKETYWRMSEWLS
jgi:hypothetical protein